MFSSAQCELARTMTNTSTPDLQIQCEYMTLTPEQKSAAATKVGTLVQLHNGPFDQVLPTMLIDFKSVADTYAVSSATLFCVYMECISSK